MRDRDSPERRVGIEHCLQDLSGGSSEEWLHMRVVVALTSAALSSPSPPLLVVVSCLSALAAAVATPFFPHLSRSWPHLMNLPNSGSNSSYSQGEALGCKVFILTNWAGHQHNTNHTSKSNNAHLRISRIVSKASYRPDSPMNVPTIEL